MRVLITILSALAYCLWATAALVTAVVARAASEDPPFSEERLLTWLALASWIAALLITVAALIRGRMWLLVAWALQASLLVAALISTLDSGDVRIAPPVVVAGAVGELAGALLIWLRSRADGRQPGGVARG